jgi:hypothetical protein
MIDASLPPHGKVTESCWMESWRSLVYIGQDVHMNGLDAPAVLRSPADARKLIAVLERLIERWPA